MDNNFVGYLWIIVMFYQLLDSHSDGTHSVSKWCNDTFLQICSHRNKLILDDLRVSTISANFHFWANYSFKITFYIVIQLSV